MGCRAAMTVERTLAVAIVILALAVLIAKLAE
jgi:hypothetical protein